MLWAGLNTTRLAFLSLIALPAFAAGPACADDRVALVIGNAAYQNVALLGPQIDLDKPGFDRVLDAAMVLSQRDSAGTTQPIPPPAAPPLTGGLTGVWNGTYYYPDGDKPVAFVFSFGSDGCLGRSEEPNTFGNKSTPKLFANLSCSAPTLSPGGEITIKKTYDGTGGVSHSVIYKGTVSADLRSISGQWTINATHGNFRMSR
jgi:hypothetical protein